MRKYHKIQSIFKREEKKPRPFIEGAWTCPEFEYLQDDDWTWTEKIDGTNIRIGWDGDRVRFGGRTENAQIPTFLYERLVDLFPPEKFKEHFDGFDGEVMLCGEGYGRKIQKMGASYKADGVDFILFDVLIGNTWLERDSVHDIAGKMGTGAVPVVGHGTLHDAIANIKDGVPSTFGDFRAEGLVLRPSTELLDRRGHRIITKLKHRDFA